MAGITGGAKGAPSQIPLQSSEIQGPGGEGGLLSKSKDAKEAATAAKFGEVWKNVQSRYGAKPEKPREIKKTLGKDDFLRIMISQMQHQDPTSPFKAEQFATQIAQFTSVEQLQNMNQQMGKMVNANQPLERLAMTNMIGKTVTIDRERFPHADNEASPLSFQLSKDAENVKINILSESGEAVFTKDIGAMRSGDQNFTWDGLKNNSLPAKGGNYIFRVEARDQSDRLIPMNTRGQAKVIGVSFEGNESILLVGDANNPQKITMKNVVRVDSNSDMAQIPGAKSLKASLGQVPAESEAGSEAEEHAAAAPTPQGKSPVTSGNYFTFEKGVGSKPIEAGALPPEAQRALKSYELAKADAESSAAKSAEQDKTAVQKNEKNSEKGFPNGISSGDND